MDDKYKNTIAGKWVAAEKTNKAHRPEIEITKDNHEKIKAVVNDDGEVTIINFDHVTTLDINNFLALCKWGMKVLGEERLSGIGDSGFVSYCFHERAIKEKDCRIKELEEKTKTWTKIAEDGTDEILRLKGAVTALRNIKDRRNEDKVGRYIDSINEQQKEIENQDIHIKHLQSQNDGQVGIIDKYQSILNADISEAQEGWVSKDWKEWQKKGGYATVWGYSCEGIHAVPVWIIPKEKDND